MGEDGARADQNSSTLPAPTISDSSAAPPVDAQDIFIRSSTPTSPTHTLTRLSTKSPTSPTGTGNQVSAITVVALLDQLVVMIEAVQENQQRMEKRQADLEGTVRAVQADLTRLSKSHTATSGGVNKLLERSRKTSIYVKEVRERLDRQSGQVKRLEANHAHLLKRNHFKVLIFQEDNEIPTTLFTKESTADIASTSAQDERAASPRASVIDPNHSHEEGLHTISLSSDEEEGAVSPLLEGSTLPREVHDDEFPGMGSERLEWSRTDKFKRSSLKKVDSLKKAFSRSSIEKKINKIVPPERREKIMKSFSPSHPKSPTSKSSSFRVSPMTFNVKKMRDGEGEATQAGGENATVEVPPMGGLDGQLPMAEVHNEEENFNGKVHSPSTTGSADGGASVTEDAELDNVPSDKVAEKEEKELQEPNEANNGAKNEANNEANNGANNGANNEADNGADAHENGGHNVGDEVEDKSMSAPESPPSAAVAIQQAS
ncbi:caveolae-associated protein 2a [Ictalurus punctatus]|uniref:Caveolae-associated protein 2a n=1 Tax=Ictalurus punctatus TaxID=7998 RepID=W5U6W7_ICTPU|nr:caveolae-associated protein 2a [Ictalurus punctatus]